MAVSYLSRVEVGRMLKNLREGRPQKELAYQLGYSPLVLSQIETGRATIPFEDLGKFIREYAGEFDLGIHKDIIQTLYPGAWDMCEEIAQEMSGVPA